MQLALTCFTDQGHQRAIRPTQMMPEIQSRSLNNRWPGAQQHHLRFAPPRLLRALIPRSASERADRITRHKMKEMIGSTLIDGHFHQPKRVHIPKGRVSIDGTEGPGMSECTVTDLEQAFGWRVRWLKSSDQIAEMVDVEDASRVQWPIGSNPTTLGQSNQAEIITVT